MDREIKRVTIKNACIKNAHIKNGCIKNLKSENGDIKNLKSENGDIQNLKSENGNIQNLDVKKLTINGKNFRCFNQSQIFTGTITPVKYVNGEPQQPANNGSFNQKVIDELWKLNLLANGVTNLDAAYGRLRNDILNNFYNCASCPLVSLGNCNCPISTYAVFTGSISGNLLTVTSMLDNSYTQCPPNIGEIKIGQRIYGQTTQFLSSVITQQISGVTGGVGVYSIANEFDDYSAQIEEQTIISISDIGLEECAAVPLRIYGVETLSVGPLNDCGVIMNAISYNINIANKTLSTKLAAVYVQVGWMDTNGTVNIQGLVIDTRQFDSSILSFGEQMNDTILLPTDLMTQISSFNSLNEVANAVIQLVVYTEDGLEVLLPITSGGVSNVRQREVSQNSNSNYSVSFAQATYCDLCPVNGPSEAFIQPPPAVFDVASNGPTGTFVTIQNDLPLIFIPQGGWYVFTKPSQGLNIGFDQSTPDGSQVPQSQFIRQYPIYDTAKLSFEDIVDFTQPPVGGIIELPIKTSPRCTFDITNYSIYLLAQNAPNSDPLFTFLGIYKVSEYTQTSVKLINTGASVNPPPGYNTKMYDFYLYLLKIVPQGPIGSPNGCQ